MTISLFPVVFTYMIYKNFLKRKGTIVSGTIKIKTHLGGGISDFVGKQYMSNFF